METVTDLAPVLDALQQISSLQVILCGVIVGCTVALILAVMFRC